jgi:3-oxoacyl-[acyl-carrier-protein] synthase II
MLAGGADTRMDPLSIARQWNYSPLSRRNDAPEKACRPFERDRDGLVLGEGAAVLVLEESGRARQRSADVLAEIVGFGAAFDNSVGGPTGAGLARAIAAALAEAEIGPADLDHVNAHGWGTIVEDAWEARGLGRAFGEASVPVFAPKSYIGDLGSAASAAELVASLFAVEHGILPATLNHDEPDPECPVTVVREPRPVTKPYFLKVAITELGQCAALVLRRPS